MGGRLASFGTPGVLSYSEEHWGAHRQAWEVMEETKPGDAWRCMLNDLEHLCHCLNFWALPVARLFGSFEIRPEETHALNSLSTTPLT